MVRSVAEILVVALFVLTFCFQPFRIPSASMQPTLNVGDFLLVDKQSFAPEGRVASRLLPPTQVHHGDLAVFLYPPDPSRDLVKRVVGLPGDRVRLHDGRVLLNGRPVSETYAVYSPSRFSIFRDDFPNLTEADPDVNEDWWLTLRRSLAGQEVVVPQAAYFVLGDNRNNSEDSRYWGFVPQRNLIGRPLAVYFSIPWHSGDAGGTNPVDPPHKPGSWSPGGVGSALRQGLHAARVLR